MASTWSLPARADEASKQARAEYDAGAAAYERKDYPTAAKHFARADERVPNSRALQLAMAASLSSNDGVLAMELVERAETRAVDGALAELAQRLRKRFASSAARIRVICPADVPCRANVDDNERTIDGGHAVWVNPGKHVAHLRANAAPKDARAVDREVTVAAGATADVTASSSELSASTAANASASASAPKSDDHVVQPPAEIRPERHATGIAPVYFWTALGVTTAAAATATVFTVMTKQKHDDFVATPSQQTADDGESAQTRARIVWGVTGALAVTTIVLAAVTDFRHSQKSTNQAGARATERRHEPVSVAVGPGSVLVVGHFQ